MFTKKYFVYTYYNVLCNFILCTLQCMSKYVNEGLREDYFLTNCVTPYKERIYYY